MKKKGLFALVALFLCQLALPLSSVYQQEMIVLKGTRIQLEMEAFDPYDVMRGRYIRLRPKLSSEWIATDETFLLGEVAYIGFNNDSPAKPITVSKSLQPNMVKVTIVDTKEKKTERGETRADKTKADKTIEIEAVRVEMNLERFYLPEADAKNVDVALRKGDRELRPQASIEIAVRKGEFTPVKLFLDGMSYVEWLEKNQGEETD